MDCVCDCFLAVLKQHILLWFRKQGHIALGDLYGGMGRLRRFVGMGW